MCLAFTKAALGRFTKQANRHLHEMHLQHFSNEEVPAILNLVYESNSALSTYKDESLSFEMAKW